jgi:hypothetical protein
MDPVFDSFTCDGRAVASMTIMSSAAAEGLWVKTKAVNARLADANNFAKVLFMSRVLAEYLQLKASNWRGKAAQFLALLIGIAPILCPAQAAEQTRVEIELVLALDVSASVDLAEFDLQLKGIEAAFKDPEVLKAVENLAPLGAAVAVVQWGGPREFKISIPFTHLVSAQDSKAFGFLAGRAIRAFGATGTSIVTAVGKSADLLETNAFDGNRRVIDVSGDGVDNSGFDLEVTRQDAKAQRIIINGLAIQEDELGLAQYFQDHLIIGPDSFVETANGYADFARAIRAKLLKELRPNSS